MATLTLRNLGGSIMMAVPKKILNLVGLGAGSRVQVSVDKSRLTIQPERKPHYTLAELLSRCRRSDLTPRRTDRSWLAPRPAGREMI